MVQETEYITTFDGNVINKQDFIDYIIGLYQNAEYNGLTKVTDFTVGSEAYHLVDVMASIMLELREELNNNYLMSMIHTAEGEALDNFGDLVGVYRRNGQASTGYVRFYLNSSPLTNEELLAHKSEEATHEILIPEGTIVSTDDSISFITSTDTTINQGEYYVDVECICEYDGEYTNVKAETILLILTDLGDYRIRCINPLEFTEGQDIEDDETYRNRILEAPDNHPVGSVSWYETIPFTSEAIAEKIHDIVATKEGLNVGEDLKLIYNPYDHNEDVVACVGQEGFTNLNVKSSECALKQFFALDEYNIIGIKLVFEEATLKYVLSSEQIPVGGVNYDVSYKIFIDLDTVNYPEANLSNTSPKVLDIVEQFNTDARINHDFSPSTLCVLIEDIPEVNDCVIYQKAVDGDNVNWGIVNDIINIPAGCVYHVSSDVEVITEGPNSDLIISPGTADTE